MKEGGKGWSKIVKICVTSFMNAPLSFQAWDFISLKFNTIKTLSVVTVGFIFASTHHMSNCNSSYRQKCRKIKNNYFKKLWLEGIKYGPPSEIVICTGTKEVTYFKSVFTQWRIYKITNGFKTGLLELIKLLKIKILYI